jgi:hypothetical protein
MSKMNIAVKKQFHRLLGCAVFGWATTGVVFGQTATTPEPGRQRGEQEDSTLKAIRAWGEKGKPYIPGARESGDLPQARIPAFPGAWGGGMYSFGGRGGQIYVVTSLEDSGPGTLREALEAVGPRIVLFNVAGIIDLKTTASIRAPYITISGAQAPGDGVCIAGAGVSIDTHDVVIRHMRFRGGRSDSVTGHPVGNIMLDHVSASWGRDENMSLYRHIYRPPEGGPDQKLPVVNITVQNTIFSECLKRGHEFGSTLGGRNSTFFLNLWANNVSRNPSVGMDGDFTLVNNVIFNWLNRTVDGGDHKSYYTLLNNYFKPGPVTPKDKPEGHRILKPEPRRGDGPNDFGKAHVAGNIMEGHDEITRDNWAGGVQLGVGGNKNKGTERPIDVTLKEIRVDQPFQHAPIPILSAEEAFKFVLANAGATLPRRDAVDERIAREVRTGEVTAKATKGIIHNASEAGGMPEYKGQPYADADKDGMPDEWEIKYSLNPKDPSDAAKDLSGDGYMNIEKFLHGIDPTKRVDWTDLKNNRDRLNPSAPVATDYRP